MLWSRLDTSHSRYQTRYLNASGTLLDNPQYLLDLSSTKIYQTVDTQTAITSSSFQITDQFTTIYSPILPQTHDREFNLTLNMISKRDLSLNVLPDTLSLIRIIPTGIDYTSVITKSDYPRQIRYHINMMRRTADNSIRLSNLSEYQDSV